MASCGRPAVNQLQKLNSELAIDRRLDWDIEVFARTIEDPRVLAIYEEKIREQEGRP